MGPSFNGAPRETFKTQ